MRTQGWRAHVCATALAAATSAAGAQNLVDATDPEQLENLLRGFGSAVIETDDVGDPMIVGRMDGTRFSVFFFGCNAQGERCDSIMFRAAWSMPGAVTTDQVNAWNRDKRFSKAYIDGDDDPVIEMDVNLGYGVSVRNFDETVNLWQLALAEFKLTVLGR